MRAEVRDSLWAQGGREHGVPILISELEAGGPAALTGELYVGDAILAINDVDLTQACHKEAVQALQSVKGDCALCVQFIATDDDDRLSEDNYRFPLYPEDGEVYGVEPDGSGATPTAPRTPDYNNRPGSEVGSAASVGSAGSESGGYPDYNSINNNLAILDMDDDNIKIEARLELPIGGRQVTSDESQSTPVHARRPNTKKKRKPQDWRTKGAYRAVEDAPSSDEHIARPPTPDTAMESPSLVTPDARESPPEPAPSLLQLEPKQIRTNGEVKLIRRESQGFRIGSARRVTAAAPVTNGDAERGKFPCLLAGDGDPDFGTPV
ncbi:unnamed protein product [Diatraea saccharalis]|uniref:PDZ domain-containing protein n=1 Tax=Diatraea saccharalis TaxID=40085 RepID=A0A9N9WBC9_9NEOP|nr:unnamed protein product [Diatraea saccharalis]